MSNSPNILFILTDDQGAWAMNCAGTPELHTPNLNRIAQNGMRFENFFCVSPVCSPARASILTGNIPSGHGVHDWLRSGNMDKEKFSKESKENPYGGYDDEDKPIQYLKGQTTYTDVLSENGYSCALSGKWHLGDSVNPQHGFKRWYTIGKGGCFYYHADMVENGKVTVEHGKYVTDLITDKALVFLDEMSKEDAPFYLSVNYTAPHSPYEAEHHPKEYIDMYDDCSFDSVPNLPDHPNATWGEIYNTPRRHSNLRGYFASITAMDTNIGRIMDSLDEKGLTESTIIIFDGYNEFYDLINDPDENENLINNKSFENNIVAMRNQLEKWFCNYVNPDIDGTKEDVSGSGQMCSAGIYSEKLMKYVKYTKE